MTRQELERWLCGPDAPVLAPGEIASVLGFPERVVFDSTLVRVEPRVRAARFTLTVLRDRFGEDAEVRRWLRRPRSELGQRAPLELLLAGVAQPVEELAVREWNGCLR